METCARMLEVTTTRGSLERKLKGVEVSGETGIRLKGSMNDDDVNYLGKYTRGHEQIRNLDLSGVSELITVDHGAFKSCTRLESFVFPDTIRQIGDHSFEECTSLQSAVLPESVERIGDMSFSGCSSLQCINIPLKVSYIGVGALGGCYELRDIKVSPENRRYSFFCNILYDGVDGTLLWYLPCGCVEKVFDTPANVKHIGNYAFDGCKGLEVVNIAEGTTDLGARSFYQCSDLATVRIPESLTNLCSDTFDGCDSLETFVVAEENKCYTSEGGVLYSKDKKRLVMFPKARKSLPELPSTLEVIDKGAFADCRNLVEFSFQSSIRQIGESAFSGCCGLREIVFTSSVESIGGFCFADCTGLKTIKVYSSRPPRCGIKVFENVEVEKCRVLVPIDTEISYRSEYGWDVFLTIEESLNMTIGANFPPLRSFAAVCQRVFMKHMRRASLV